MANLSIRNEVVMVAVFDDTKLNFQLAPGGVPDGQWLTRRNRLIAADAGISGEVPSEWIYCYALPTTFESLIVRQEGNPRPLYEEQTGRLPQAVEDADLDMYPCLHFLEEKRVAAPWRMERWYTLVGPYLAFECHQYFERPLKGRRESRRTWERIMSDLRQVVDIRSLAANNLSEAT